VRTFFIIVGGSAALLGGYALWKRYKNPSHNVPVDRGGHPLPTRDHRTP